MNAARHFQRRAVDKFIATHELEPEQMRWLSLVRDHLVKNLPMDEEDFDPAPLLEMRGGKAKAQKVFGELSLLVIQLDEAVAA
ncbi:MAG: type I restriction-modification enzyme R subunit C-terminal domain-containing protein [Limisphaerales bacterium]